MQGPSNAYLVARAPFGWVDRKPRPVQLPAEKATGEEFS
jgi:hypothetical protein